MTKSKMDNHFANVIKVKEMIEDIAQQCGESSSVVFSDMILHLIFFKNEYAPYVCSPQILVNNLAAAFKVAPVILKKVENQYDNDVPF